MLSKIHIYLTGIFLITLTVCAQAQAKPIKFIQRETIFVIANSTDSITLKREPFSLRYFCKPYNGKKKKFYSAKVAVLTNAADIGLFQVGKSMMANQYFGLGTGMAVYEDGFYRTIFLSNEGNHYLFYENEENKRVSLVSRTKKLLELEFEISAAFYEDKKVPFSELKFSVLYFVILIDGNLDDVIDKGECRIVKVRFKS